MAIAANKSRLIRGARFKATAAMYAMMNIGDDTWSGIVRDGKFVGGVFDCNNLASVGVFAPFYELLDVRDTTVWNYNDAGFVMGSISTPGSSYEGFLTNCHTNRSLNAASAGSVSVRWNRGGDNHMDIASSKDMRFAAYPVTVRGT
ncbi:hypothetical protein [Brucella oryzae]|uniref:hypothetical protein n=1 Tax=Brucella oryzae TaxID=335286 RepID=UPI0011B0CB00|nr:hypothetical protein [Brucella oryzae]